jgi:hypothetical protein
VQEDGIPNVEEWGILGSGNRHIVFSHVSHDFVVRLERSMSTASCEELWGSVKFHNEFLLEIFRGYIYPVTLRLCSAEIFMALMTKYDSFDIGLRDEKVPCVLTRNLMSSTTVELKPKYSHSRCEPGESWFVLEQLARNEEVVYDPRPIFEGTDRDAVTRALSSACLHRKRYIKVHSNEKKLSDVEIKTLMAEAVMTDSLRNVFHRLEKLQSYASDKHAKLAKSILIETREKRDFSFPPSLPSPQHYKDMAVDDGEKFLNVFLAGRMAMDVSLIFNFFRETNPHADLIPIPLSNGWKCCVGIIDTELKPRSKIPLYAAQHKTVTKGISTEVEKHVDQCID